jgi:hypothetical protein
MVTRKKERIRATRKKAEVTEEAVIKPLIGKETR